MSNAYAVAAVTASIASIARSALDGLGIVPAPTVGTAALDDTAALPRIGVHLMRVARHSGYAVESLPLRASDGSLRRTPQASLELHYLLSFRGESEWATQRMLARVAAAFEAEAGIRADRLALAAADTPEIAGNDLAEAPEPVHLAVEWPSLEDITRVWSIFTPGAFTLTLGVSGSPVLVDTDEAPVTPIPVARVSGDAVPEVPPIVPPSPAGPGYALGAVTASTAAGGAPGTRSGTVTAAVSPPLPAGARVRLLLDTRPPAAPAGIALAAAIAPPGGTGSLTLPVTDAPAGAYRVTLEVDGVRSLPAKAASGDWILEVVTL